MIINAYSSSSSSSSGTHTIMALFLSTGVGQFVNALKREHEIQIEEQRREITRLKERDEARERENEALRKNNEDNAARNNKYLNGVVAEKKITAFEMWREIVMFL